MQFAVGIVIWALLLVVGFVRVLGSFAGHFPSHGVFGFRRDLSAWRQGWRTRPRPAVSWRDWFPHTGAVFVPAYIAVLFAATSIGLLTSSPHRTGLGIACAAAACCLTGLLVQFFRRPVRDPFDATAAAAVIDGRRQLLVTSRGYDRGDVDRFLHDIAAHSVADIEAVTFKTSWSGYDPQEVDALLTLWAWRKRYPPGDGHWQPVVTNGGEPVPTAPRPQAPGD